MVTRPKPFTQEALREARPVEFFKSTWQEMQKVTWPTREETLRLTVVVIILSLALGLILAGLDTLLTQTFGRFVLGT